MASNEESSVCCLSIVAIAFLLLGLVYMLTFVVGLVMSRYIGSGSNVCSFKTLTGALVLNLLAFSGDEDLSLFGF